MFDELFDSSALKDFMPHGMCLLWRTDLLLLHVISDALIALSYFSIPVALIYFVAKRQDLQFRAIFILFGIFILACGSTHAMQIWTIWRPDYVQEGVLKLFTALTSMGTAIVLWPLIPHALRLPSPAVLEQANLRLQHEIDERERTEHQVRLLNNELERKVEARTRELVAANVHLEQEIHERKRAEAELIEADRRKDEFLATLAHELRNPLAPIRNSVELLKLSPELVRQAGDIIDRQLRHLTRLVDDLLDVARITSGRIRLQKTTVKLGDVIAQAVETVRPLIDARRHQLILALPQQPPLFVEADPIRLAQVISNLLDNAAKYTEQGGRIELSLAREGEEAVLSVTDTGIGIPAGMSVRIFDMFMQTDRSTRLAKEGLGLGLTLVRRLVEMHGGSVQAFSEGSGLGSRFVVRLPLLPDNTEKAPSPAAADVAPSSTAHRILVVDDNADIADTLALLLQAKGYRVHTAYSGKTALSAAGELTPDIVLLDIGMPDMTGFEVAEALRTRYPDRRMLLIAVSGYGQEDDRRRAKQAGFDHLLLKPVDIQDLIDLFDASHHG